MPTGQPGRAPHRPARPCVTPAPGHTWRPATRGRYRWSYGAWLAFLEGRDPPSLEDLPALRMTEDRVLAFVDDLRARDLASATVASHVQALHNALWAMVPEADWSWLKQIVNFLVRNARPAPADLSRIHPIDTVYAAALGLMDRAEAMLPKRPFEDNIWYRDGLMVAVAAATVLRRRNLAGLDLEHHLTRQSDGWYLAIPGEEVKNHRLIEGPLPGSLTPYLDRYIEGHRPRLLQGRQSWRLWINQYGEDVSINGITARVLKVTTRLGYPMRAHDFRRSAATTIAEVRPDLARIIGHFLGHGGHHTGEVYYNKAQMAVSVRRHAETIAGYKESLRPDATGGP